MSLSVATMVLLFRSFVLFCILFPSVYFISFVSLACSRAQHALPCKVIWPRTVSPWMALPMTRPRFVSSWYSLLSQNPVHRAALREPATRVFLWTDCESEKTRQAALSRPQPLSLRQLVVRDLGLFLVCSCPSEIFPECLLQRRQHVLRSRD